MLSSTPSLGSSTFMGMSADSPAFETCVSFVSRSLFHVLHVFCPVDVIYSVNILFFFHQGLRRLRSTALSSSALTTPMRNSSNNSTWWAAGFYICSSVSSWVFKNNCFVNLLLCLRCVKFNPQLCVHMFSACVQAGAGGVHERADPLDSDWLLRQSALHQPYRSQDGDPGPAGWGVQGALYGVHWIRLIFLATDIILIKQQNRT